MRTIVRKERVVRIAPIFRARSTYKVTIRSLSAWLEQAARAVAAGPIRQRSQYFAAGRSEPAFQPIRKKGRNRYSLPTPVVGVLTSTYNSGEFPRVTMEAVPCGIRLV